ncbi:MAG: HAD-IIIA family hydrolase, partial [Proteobacteria bacterium]|nr:HAD-IIIA family hydrolase [Pseudomonadota bacterium]
ICFAEYFVKEVFEGINQKLGKWEVQLDGFYYCPHHLRGHPPYNINCDCRKPAPGMIHQAEAEFDIDMTNSFMIGDKLCDVELGLNTGIKSILLLTGHGCEERSKVMLRYPDIPVLQSFSDGVDNILINT